jgi:hypothetical protein
MRLPRAPILAIALFALVLAARIADANPGSGDQSTPKSAPSGHQNAVVTTVAPATSTSTTLVVPPTTTSTVVEVIGDDDPVAVDTRSWTWDQLADCESGRWGADKVPIAGTATWTATRAIYQGGLQFAAGTWDHYAEPGFPADAQLATREQQIVVAEKVIARQGPRSWPTCAPRLGMIGPDLPLDAPVEPSVPLAEALP